MKTKPPAQIKINLLPKDPFFESVVGRSLKWALSAGRYVVIFTELVVIVSFITRFTLDRQLTDVNGEITQREAVVQSYDDLEGNFRAAQNKIAKIKELDQESNITEVFPYISEITPEGIELSKLLISPTNISAEGSTLSQTAFNVFVSNLELSPYFVNVSIDKVGSKKDNEAGFAFTVRANTNTKAVRANSPASTNNTEENAGDSDIDDTSEPEEN